MTVSEPLLYSMLQSFYHVSSHGILTFFSRNRERLCSRSYFACKGNFFRFARLPTSNNSAALV